MCYVCREEGYPPTRCWGVRPDWSESAVETGRLFAQEAVEDNDDKDYYKWRQAMRGFASASYYRAPVPDHIREDYRRLTGMEPPSIITVPSPPPRESWRDRRRRKRTERDELVFRARGMLSWGRL